MPTIHRFDSTGEAYDLCWRSKHIHKGDVLWIPSERVVGIGNVSRDTLDFTVVEAVQTTLSEFVVYPNPSSGPLCFSFRSSTAGEATASIYTIAGRRIWEDSRNFEAGYCQMVWNGLDADGDAPASGAYIYLLRFEGEAGSDTERGVLGIVRGS